MSNRQEAGELHNPDRLSQLPNFRGFHVMAKPGGGSCNLACDYCFYLGKKALYPDSSFRMTEAVHDAYITQLLAAHRTAHKVTVAWQGGEPTLMGLDFFRRSLDFQKKVATPGQRVQNTFQTNGVLLDDDWCRFFHDHQFLVGLSLDGPQDLHDFYRKDAAGQGTHDRVMRAVRLLQKHRVEFNALCAVNAKNADHPSLVYRFFRDKAKIPYLQFIPIVEQDLADGSPTDAPASRRSVGAEQFGRFLVTVFDEWIRRDVGKMFVINFDGMLAGWLGLAGTFCLFGQTCGADVALEHNGDLYACDHFVDPKHFLGNILAQPLADIVNSAKQRDFGQAKWSLLPQYCRKCDYLFACNGECPKNRFCKTPEGELGLNYLCRGYLKFFRYADPFLRVLAGLIRQGRPAAEIMKMVMEKQIQAGSR